MWGVRNHILRIGSQFVNLTHGKHAVTLIKILCSLCNVEVAAVAGLATYLFHKVTVGSRNSMA